MQGAAQVFAPRIRAMAGRTDVLLATDMCDLATLLGLTRGPEAPVAAAAYFHENQLTYPLPDDPTTGPMRRQHGERDLHYALINYNTLLAADLAIWNSQFHLDQFLGELPRMLRRFPDETETLPTEELRAKCLVLPPGIEIDLDPVSGRGAGDSPLVLYSQRWEYDKNPSELLEALYALQEDGIAFRVALCGENQRREPTEFLAARDRLGDRLVQFGRADERRYRQLLREADIVVSTARHEFFGIAVAEACAHGAFPVLPRRLAYPELIPVEYHEACLFDGDGSSGEERPHDREKREPRGRDLKGRLRFAIEEVPMRRKAAEAIARSMHRFAWTSLAPQYDAALESLPERRRRSSDRA